MYDDYSGEQMDREAFLAEVAQILEVGVGDLKDDLALTDENWDSLAQVSVLLALDQYSDRKVAVDELSKCKSFRDLMALAQ